MNSNIRAVISMVLNALDRDADEGKVARGEMAKELRAALSAPVPPAGDVPEYFVAACDKFDWTPEEALRFYAEGKHFDTVDGRTRILCTGAIASHALKGMAGEYADMKGIEPAGDVEVLLDGVFDEMSRRFDLSKRDDDHMVYDDTQIGVEFAIKSLRPVLTRLTAERDRLRGDLDRAEATIKRSVAVEDYEAMQTELTAERDVLLAKVERLKNLNKGQSAETDRVIEMIAYGYKVKREQLQSELTKARELIKRAAMSDGISQRSPLGRDLAEFLAHQSAPASKGEPKVRESLLQENQRVTPARFKCLACGEYHEGMGGLPCPKMMPYSEVKP